MARLVRIEFEGALYHLTGRGNERQLIFVSKADHEGLLFLRKVRNARKKCVLLHG